MKVYTRRGDGGETGLVSGPRVPKGHPRVEAYGTVDELNAVLGLLLAEPVPEPAAVQLADVQRNLFSVGAVLADPEGRLGDGEWDAVALERWIDAMEAELEPLASFVLPGGTRAAALAHLARTVCRRAERRVTALDGALPEGLLPYLNRLSDALFVLARWLNRRAGVSDVLWRGRPDRRG
ncbi:MAG TPA: cob(I)yrinic acid a,c-diamide adenosyltransferase [Acidobacteria bacterium]|nr:cob(I)yrinic acid a,c-diamide adenosyltransferase [Acidobacteriota bacterium]